MKAKIPALPEVLKLSDFEKQIYAFILENWPTTPLEIATQMNEDIASREKKKRISTKYSYYLKKLVEKKLLLSKKAGNGMIVWPLMVEKYRTIHNILKHQEVEHITAINMHKKNENKYPEKEEENELPKSAKLLGVN